MNARQQKQIERMVFRVMITALIIGLLGGIAIGLIIGMHAWAGAPSQLHEHRSIPRPSAEAGLAVVVFSWTPNGGTGR